MKKSIKLLTALAFCSAAFTVTSCIEETMPTDFVLQDELDQSPNSVSGMLMALPASFNTLDARTGNFGDYAIGYGGLMHIRDVETEDMAIAFSDYDHFQPWETLDQMGDNMARTQWLWNYQYEVILSANKLIAAVKAKEEPSSLDLGALGAAYAQRAAIYLDLAREYEFLPNDKFSGTNSDGNNVTNLTVPIITDETTEEETKNNPRVPRDEMAEFIENDLDSAQKYIPYLDNNRTYSGDRTLPHLDVVYGLYARLYMWLEKYQEAATYARNAITLTERGNGYAKATSVTDLSDCFSTVVQVDGNGQEQVAYQILPTSFNTMSSNKWMWGVQQTSENSTVTSGILNWTSWMSPEYAGGYAGAGAAPCIYLPLYNQIGSYDWRSLFWNSQDLVNPGVSQKFQPNEGNTSNATVACAAAYPLMRVEEMYFIEAEAIAHLSPDAGKKALEDFINNHRWITDERVNPRGEKYTCNATSPDDVIREIVFQKRIELWGEGQTFFDIKRLNYSVDRTQDGSNFFDDARFKTSGRPAWMNWVIVISEQNSNNALVGWNNPDPTGSYTPVAGN